MSFPLKVFHSRIDEEMQPMTYGNDVGAEWLDNDLGLTHRTLWEIQNAKECVVGDLLSGYKDGIHCRFLYSGVGTFYVPAKGM